MTETGPYFRFDLHDAWVSAFGPALNEDNQTADLAG